MEDNLPKAVCSFCKAAFAYGEVMKSYSDSDTIERGCTICGAVVCEPCASQKWWDHLDVLRKVCRPCAERFGIDQRTTGHPSIIDLCRQYHATGTTKVACGPCGRQAAVPEVIASFLVCIDCNAVICSSCAKHQGATSWIGGDLRSICCSRCREKKEHEAEERRKSERGAAESCTRCGRSFDGIAYGEKVVSSLIPCAYCGVKICLSCKVQVPIRGVPSFCCPGCAADPIAAERRRAERMAEEARRRAEAPGSWFGRLRRLPGRAQ